MIEPPWDRDRLRREFESLLHVDMARNGPMPSAAEGAGAGTGAAAAPALSDDALAAAFVARHGTDWRHVPASGTWYRWNGQVWKDDETALVRELVRQVCRLAAAQAEKPGEMRRVASDKTIVAALRVAAADPALATRMADWDSHPMLLNTPSGVIDLETGEPHHGAAFFELLDKVMPDWERRKQRLERAMA